jgi:hypothetical protein
LATSATSAGFLSRFVHFANNYSRAREVSSDFERAAERFDVAAQVPHMHVSTLFKLRYDRLAHCERFGHFLSPEGARFAQLFECHYLTQRSGLRRYTDRRSSWIEGVKHWRYSGI